MKKLITLIFAAVLVSGCSTMKKSSHRGAKKAVIKMVNAIDTKEWEVAKVYFDEKVFVDYSSMTGQPGSEVKSEDLVNGWAELLKKAQTHHMLTNFDVSVDGNSAEIFSHVYASHDAKRVKYWDIYGRYHHKLVRTPQGWKITFMKLLVHGQKGNLKFLQQVSK